MIQWIKQQLRTYWHINEFKGYKQEQIHGHEHGWELLGSRGSTGRLEDEYDQNSLYIFIKLSKLNK